jgi:uncharacterized membrane protein
VPRTRTRNVRTSPAHYGSLEQLERRIEHIADDVDAMRDARVQRPDQWTYRLIVFFLGVALVTAVVAALALAIERRDVPAVLWIATVGTVVALGVLGMIQAVFARREQTELEAVRTPERLVEPGHDGHEARAQTGRAPVPAP